MADAGSSDVRAWLDGHVNLETGRPGDLPGARRTAPTLDRIARLVDLLGSPQCGYPVVHITGTNGKTSTARMIAALLAVKGLTVGSYTSPHLERVNERIARDAEPIGDEDLDEVLEVVRRVEPLMPERPTYFEILTAAAFTWFADAGVDVAVVEVGIGGTWDATNVADGVVAVVTNIGIDHVEYLGPDRLSIAKEKAGIVKEGAVLVLGETDPELTPVFTGGVQLEAVHLRDRDFSVRANRMAHGGRLLDLAVSDREFSDVYLPVHGGHQGDNAVVALAAADAFFGGAAYDRDLVAEAFGGLAIPGRLEVVGHQPLVVLDGAHNAAGARALRAALAEEFPTSERTLVVGLLREKEPHEMLEALGVREAERLVVCRPPSPRALDPEVVAGAARDLGFPARAIEVADLVAEAVARAMAATPPQGQVVVTGSLYTVGAARSVLVTT